MSVSDETVQSRLGKRGTELLLHGHGVRAVRDAEAARRPGST